MKNFKEEIEAMKAQIAALENNLVEQAEVECDGQCGCGCDESPVETEDEVSGGMRHCGDDYYDEGPEFDGAGFSEADRVVTPEQADTIVFTREELIDFAAKLMERTVIACKEAVSEVEFEADYCCELSLSYNNQIEVEIDNSVIRDAIENEIDNTIELDNDTVETEVTNILEDMLLESEVKNKLFP